IAARQGAKFSSVSRAAAVSDLTSDRRWRIVLARDRRYDGAFVYAVQSTGIYCRPSCPSRRPRRAHVAFFPGPQAAELAGFRPCRRCRPGEAAAAVPGVPLVQAVCRLIDAHPDRPASLAVLSARAGVTSHRLLRTFRRVLGISPRQYRDARRLDRFKTELRARGRVSPALYEAGYGSTSRVYERAHAQLGMTPATYSRGAPGTRIAFAIVPCAFGRLLVATTARGICRISLGSGAKALAAGLRAEFPAAELRRDRSALAASVGTLLRYPLLRRDRPCHRRAVRYARRGARLRDEPRGARHPLPPGRGSRRRARWLPLGSRAQTRPVGTGAGDHRELGLRLGRFFGLELDLHGVEREWTGPGHQPFSFRLHRPARRERSLHLRQ